MTWHASVRIDKLGTGKNAAIISIGFAHIKIKNDAFAITTSRLIANLDVQKDRAIEPRTMRDWMLQPYETRKVFESNGLQKRELLHSTMNALVGIDGFVLIDPMDQTVLSDFFNLDFSLFAGKNLATNESLMDLWQIPSQSVRVHAEAYNAEIDAGHDVRTFYELLKLKGSA